jgi:hypothetical protein
MNVMRRRALKMGTLLAGAALLWSCVAPILTVPPPNAIAFAATTLTDADGGQEMAWIASGGPLEQAANADYFIFNRTLGAGIIAVAGNDGSFTAQQPMNGNAGDQVLVYYKTPYGDYSDSICVLLEPATAGSPLPTCPQ